MVKADGAADGVADGVAERAMVVVTVVTLADTEVAKATAVV